MTSIFNSPPNGGRAGTFIRQPSGFRAFIPRPLPPDSPPLELTLERTRLLSDATLALGRLDAAERIDCDVPTQADSLKWYSGQRDCVCNYAANGTQRAPNTRYKVGRFVTEVVDAVWDNRRDV